MSRSTPHQLPLRRPRATAATTAAAVAALVAGLAACSTPDAEAADAPGVTDDSVTIGTHTPLTGPAAAGYSSISAAATAYFEYLNDQGGIHGRTIEYVVKDDGYNPATTSTVVRDLVQNEKVFAIVNGLGTPTHLGVLDYLNEQGVPDLFVASGSASFNQPEAMPWTFGFNTDYVTEGKVLAHYVAEQRPDETYCLLRQDDEFGENLATGIEHGVELASVQTYAVSDDNVTAQIGAMQAAGCTVNFLATVNGFTAMAIGTAAQMKYAATWATSSSGGDYPTLVGFLGEDLGPALLEGLISTNYLPFGATDEWVTLFQEINDEYNDGAPFTGNTIYGMSVAYTFAEALLRAGEDPTRDSLVEALRSGEVQGNGILPLAFADDDHSAFHGAGITEVHEGVQAYVDGQVLTTDAADGAVEPFDGDAVALENEGVPSE